MKRLLIVSVSVVIALAAVAITALAMDSAPSVVEVPAQGTAQLAFVHLAPFAPGPATAVTVTLDSTPILTDFAFADSTGYRWVSTGTHLVELYPAGSSSPAVTETVTLQEDTDWTVFAIGGANNWPLMLLPFRDDNTPPAAGNARVRLGHLAPFTSPPFAATRVDVRHQDGSIVFEDLNYSALGPFLPEPEGSRDLKVTTPGGSATLIDPVPVNLDEGDIVSFFFVGDGRNQPLGVFVLPSGQPGYLLPLSPRLAIAHLAPFAADTATAVTVTLDSTPILTDFAFADSTGYRWVSTGTHLVELYPAGSTSPAVTETVTLQEDTDWTVFAIGGANEWSLMLLPFRDDNTPPAAGNARVRLGHLAPFTSPPFAATRVDVRHQDGSIIFEDLNYSALGPFLPEPEGSRDLKVTTPGGSATLIDPVPVNLNDGDIVSFFFVGDGDNQPLGAFVLPSGQPGYLLPLTKYVYLPLVVRGFGP